MMRSIFCFLILGIGFAIVCAHEKEAHWENEVPVEFQECNESTCWSGSSSSDDIDYEQHSTDVSFTPLPYSPISNVTIYRTVPRYCQQGLVSGNVNLTMCENEWKPLPLNEGLMRAEENCSMVEHAFKHLRSLCANDTSTETSLKTLVNSFGNISVSPSLWNIEGKKQILTTLSLLMEGISSVVLSITLARGAPQDVFQNSMVIQTDLISQESFRKNETLTLKAQGDQMAIHSRAVTAVITDPIAVAFTSYSKLELILEKALPQNEKFLDNEMLKKVNSRLVSVFTSNHRMNISIPVNLTFQHLEKNVAQVKVLCVHLNSGTFSDHGCQHLSSNITHTECSCQHLSSFAVLMATTPKHGDLILTIISYLGLSISVICLFLCIVTFLFCRSSHNSSTFIHLQLSFCLFFADLLFLIGINKTGNKILCSVIAGMLKCLFLACFAWMFLEGVNLFLIVRNLKVANYSGPSKYMKISMYLIGYGFPILIVVISAAIKPGAFGTPYRCWLNPDFIWSFAGPICAIIAVNLVFFCLILKTLHGKLSSLNSEISAVKNTRSLMFKAIAHVFILGVTWCFGLFQYGPLEVVMAYMFTIFNSVQGIFIFLVHCLLNRKVRDAYWHWVYCKKDIRPPVSEISMMSVPISIPSVNLSCVNAVDNQEMPWKEDPILSVSPLDSSYRLNEIEEK